MLVSCTLQAHLRAGFPLAGEECVVVTVYVHWRSLAEGEQHVEMCRNEVSVEPPLLTT